MRKALGRPKLTLEAMQALAQEKGGACLSETYESSQAKLRWRCREGHEWEAKPASVKAQGSWCPSCAPRGRPKLTLEAMQKQAQEKGGACLSETYEGSQAKLRWRCREGHEWEATATSVRNLGSWCPNCAPRGRPALTLAEAQEAAQARGGQCQSDNCEGSQAKLRWRCHAGHEWEATLSSVRNLGTWCPHCRASAGEKRCRDTLARHLGPPSFERRPAFTRTAETPVGLELDIYYPEHGLAVEVQGAQHNRWTRYFQPREEDFVALQRRDEIKRALCAENWVVLLEVGPNVTEKELVAHLEELGILSA